MIIWIIFISELTELQALFKSRIKAEKELEAKEKHIPVSLLYDEDNLTEIPPPLKICMEALDSLIKFRVNYYKLKYINSRVLVVYG